MSLQNWLQNSWLVVHVSSAEEISDLLRLADRDIEACQLKGLPADWRIRIAYNSALEAPRRRWTRQDNARPETIVIIV